MDYQKQAEDFCKKVGLTIAKKFIKNDYHFADDKDTRDIYSITMWKANRETVWRDDKKISFKFGQSISSSDGNTPPTNYDILATLTKYDPESFENFCNEFDYEEDSRKAMKIYKAVKKEWEKVSSLFTNVELDALRDIN